MLQQNCSDLPKHGASFTFYFQGNNVFAGAALVSFKGMPFINYGIFFHYIPQSVLRQYRSFDSCKRSFDSCKRLTGCSKMCTIKKQSFSEVLEWAEF